MDRKLFFPESAKFVYIIYLSYSFRGYYFICYFELEQIFFLCNIPNTNSSRNLHRLVALKFAGRLKKQLIGTKLTIKNVAIRKCFLHEISPIPQSSVQITTKVVQAIFLRRSAHINAGKSIQIIQYNAVPNLNSYLATNLSHCSHLHVRLFTYNQFVNIK